VPNRAEWHPVSASRDNFVRNFSRRTRSPYFRLQCKSSQCQGSEGTSAMGCAPKHSSMPGAHCIFSCALFASLSASAPTSYARARLALDLTAGVRGEFCLPGHMGRPAMFALSRCRAPPLRTSVHARRMLSSKTPELRSVVVQVQAIPHLLADASAARFSLVACRAASAATVGV